MNFDRVLRLKVGEIFELSHKTNGSWFTKKFINENKGTIPVYSASKLASTVGYGYVKDNVEGVNYFNDCLTWNIDGSIGKAHYRNGRFSLSEKVIPLILKEKYEKKLDYMFLKYSLEDRAIDYGFGYSNKAGKEKIANIEIDIPCDGGNCPSIELQNRFTKARNEIDSIQKIVIDAKDNLKLSTVLFSSLLKGRPTRALYLTDDVFCFETRKTGWTKSVYQKIGTGDKSDNPVYTAARKPVAFVNDVNNKLIIATPSNPKISFASNGDGSAGTNFILHKSNFYVSNDRTVLSINSKDIDCKFIYYSLHGMKQAYGFNHAFKAISRNLSCVLIEIPINEKENFDLDTQIAIAKRYEILENARNEILQELELLSSAQILIK